jgi:hypothetical protein
MNYHSSTLVIIIGLILFSIFRRVKRNIGWQQLNSRILVTRTAIFSIIGIVFFVLGAFHPISFVSDVIGILIGIFLAYFCGVMTQFKQRDGCLFYRTNTWIGGYCNCLILCTSHLPLLRNGHIRSW